MTLLDELFIAQVTQPVAFSELFVSVFGEGGLEVERGEEYTGVALVDMAESGQVL